MNLLRDYRADLLEALKLPKEAAEYINAALDEEDPNCDGMASVKKVEFSLMHNPL